MLVCPSCHSTNPDRNKFCQRCGTSLTEKTCPKCNYNRVPYEAASCPNCRQFTGQIWRVSIQPIGNVEKTLIPVVAESEISPPPTPPLASQTASEVETLEKDSSIQAIQPPVNSESNDATTVEVETTVDSTDFPDAIATTSAEAEIEAQSSVQAIQSPEANVCESNDAPTVEVETTVDSTDSPDASSEAETLERQSSIQAIQSPVNSESNDAPTVEVETTVDSTDSPDVKQLLPELTSSGVANPVATSDSPDLYLDLEQRYKLFNTDPSNLKVLDVKPLQATVLSAIPQWNQSSREKQQQVDQPHLNTPKIALDYLKLQEKCQASAIPIIHDAWQDDEAVVLLLEDRSQWASLGQFWSTPEMQTGKVLTWMTQMAELWAVLDQEGYGQSLLDIDNLKLDEDETIGLEQLYPSESSSGTDLRKLGELWCELFGQSAKTQFLSLSQMLKSMCNGEIEDVAQLKSELRSINDELQPGAMAEDTPNLLDDRAFDLDELDEGDESPTVVLPKRLTALEDAGVTHPGKQRPYNEDFFAIETKTCKIESPEGESVTAKGLYILCDGMGGHAGGDVASKTAVKIIKNFFEDKWQDNLPDENTIKEAIFLANQELYNLNQKNASSGTGRMGTTLVMLLIHNTQAAIAHVGDSRLYSMSKQGGLQRLTVDHEVGQREIQRGVEESIAYSRPDAYQLTQALGPRDRNFIKPDVKFMEIDRDILLILGSDGLTDNDLLETYGSTYLLPLLSSTDNLDRGANKLIELANEYNGHDNITAVLVRVRAAS